MGDAKPRPGRGGPDILADQGRNASAISLPPRSWKIHDDLFIVRGLDLLEVTSQSGIVFGIEQDEIERH